MATRGNNNRSNCGTEHGGTCDHVVATTAAGAAVEVVKVKFIFKLINFTCAVIALSWFFEGWRQINESLTFAHAAILAAGTVFTLLFLGVHAYWVYFEEKQKGTLKKRVEWFEKIHIALEKRQSEMVVTDKGES